MVVAVHAAPAFSSKPAVLEAFLARTCRSTLVKASGSQDASVESDRRMVAYSPALVVHDGLDELEADVVAHVPDFSDLQQSNDEVVVVLVEQRSSSKNACL